MSDNSENMDYVVPPDDTLRQREKDWANFYLKYSAKDTDDQSDYGGSDLSAMGREPVDSEPESVSPSSFVATGVDGQQNNDSTDDEDVENIEQAKQQVQDACQRRLALWEAGGLDISVVQPPPDPLTTTRDRIDEWLTKSQLPAPTDAGTNESSISNVIHHQSTSTMTSMVHNSHARNGRHGRQGHQEELRHTETVTTFVQRVLFRSVSSTSGANASTLAQSLPAIESPMSDNVFKPPTPPLSTLSSSSTAAAAPKKQQRHDIQTASHQSRHKAVGGSESSHGDDDAATDPDQPAVAFRLPRTHRSQRSPTVFRKTPVAMPKKAGRKEEIDDAKQRRADHLQQIVERLPLKSCLKRGQAQVDIMHTKSGKHAAVSAKSSASRRVSTGSSTSGDEVAIATSASSKAVAIGEPKKKQENNPQQIVTARSQHKSRPDVIPTKPSKLVVSSKTILRRKAFSSSSSSDEDHVDVPASSASLKTSTKSSFNDSARLHTNCDNTTSANSALRDPKPSIHQRPADRANASQVTAAAHNHGEHPPKHSAGLSVEGTDVAMNSPHRSRSRSRRPRDQRQAQARSNACKRSDRAKAYESQPSKTNSALSASSVDEEEVTSRKMSSNARETTSEAIEVRRLHLKESKHKHGKHAPKHRAGLSAEGTDVAMDSAHRSPSRLRRPPNQRQAETTSNSGKRSDHAKAHDPKPSQTNSVLSASSVDEEVVTSRKTSSKPETQDSLRSKKHDTVTKTYAEKDAGKPSKQVRHPEAHIQSSDRDILATKPAAAKHSKATNKHSTHVANGMVTDLKQLHLIESKSQRSSTSDAATKPNKVVPRDTKPTGKGNEADLPASTYAEKDAGKPSKQVRHPEAHIQTSDGGILATKPAAAKHSKATNKHSTHVANGMVTELKQMHLTESKSQRSSTSDAATKSNKVAPRDTKPSGKGNQADLPASMPAAIRSRPKKQSARDPHDDCQPPHDDSALAMPPPLKIPPRRGRVATVDKRPAVVPEIHRPIAAPSVFNTNNTLTDKKSSDLSVDFKNQLHSTANVASQSTIDTSAVASSASLNSLQYPRFRRHPNKRSVVLFDLAACTSPSPVAGGTFSMTIREIADRMQLSAVERRKLFPEMPAEACIRYPTDATYTVNWVPKPPPPPGPRPLHFFDSSDSSDEEDILDLMDRMPWIEKL